MLKRDGKGPAGKHRKPQSDKKVVRILRLTKNKGASGTTRNYFKVRNLLAMRWPEPAS